MAAAAQRSVVAAAARVRAEGAVSIRHAMRPTIIAMV